MKKGFLLVLTMLAAVFLFITLVNAAEITTCTNFTSAGVYNLTANVSSTFSDCMRIYSRDVYLNCNNSVRITGTLNGTGLNITNSTNVTITNCIFSNFSRGAHIETVNDTALESLTFMENNGTHAGIYVVGANASNITDTIVRASKGTWSAGVYLNGSNEMRVADVLITNNTVNNTQNITTLGSSLFAIYLSNTTTVSGVNLTRNDVTGNEGEIMGGAALGIYTSLYATVSNLLLNANVIVINGNILGGGLVGLSVSGDNSTISGSTFTNNNVTTTANNMTSNSTISSGGALGIFSSSYNTLSNNLFSMNNYSFASAQTGLIAIANSSANNTISSNDIKGINYSLNGIYIGQEADDDNAISSNNVSNVSTAIYVGAVNATLDSNTVFTSTVGFMLNGTVNLTNSNITDHTLLGMNASNSTAMVTWFVDGETHVENSNLTINGTILFRGGTLQLVDSYITLNGTFINITNRNVTSLDVATQAISLDTMTNFSDSNNDCNVTVYTNATVAGAQIAITRGTSFGPSSYTSVKTIDVHADAVTTANLNWSTITIYYNDTEISDLSINEDTLTIKYYNDTSGLWVDEPLVGLDTTNNFAWVNTSHFSLFSLVGFVPSSGSPSPGSGGTSSSSNDEDTVVETCSESWVCGSWTACSDGTQTRNCFDANTCGTVDSKPSVSKSCAVAQPTPAPQPKPKPTPQPSRDVTAGQAVAQPEPEAETSNAWIYGLGVIVALIVVWIVVMLVKKK